MRIFDRGLVELSCAENLDKYTTTPGICISAKNFISNNGIFCCC